MATEEQKEQVSKNQDERDKARQDLRDTLTEVNAKVESARADLRSDHLIESHPVAASLVAGALGFLIGSTIDSRRTGPIMIAAVLSFALSMRSTNKASEPDGRQRSSTD
jgi:ElaB/YqjD/DUF883 family membrane-anchored ribosome-binding protein